MTKDTYKGIAIGMLIAYFLVIPILSAIKLALLIPYIIIGGAVYLFFFKK